MEIKCEIKSEWKLFYDAKTMFLSAMETTSTQTQCPVSKILQRYIKELKLTVLLVLTE